MNKMQVKIKEDQKTFVVERSFKAPKSRVWAAWTTPELFVKWWGPKGWKTLVKEMDFRVGGRLHYGMVCEDPAQTEWFGKTSWGLSKYTKIDAENSFEYSDEFCDEEAHVTPGIPAMEIHLEFIAQGESTLVRSTTLFDSPKALEQVIAMGMEEGLTQTWDRLEALLQA